MLIVAAISTLGALAYFHNLNHHYQRNIQQTIKQLQNQKTLQQQELDKKLQKLRQDNQNLQKQLVLKQAKARLASIQAAPAVLAPKPTISGGCNAYRPLVASYGWDVSVAMAIMQAESRCDPTAASPTCDHGLMQINCVHADLVGGNLGLLNDPATNIKVAYQVYASAGWSAWTTYSSGAYLRYL